MLIKLSSRESGWCVALVAMKGLLQRISHHERLLSSKGMCRTDGCAFGSPNLRDTGFSHGAGSHSVGNLESLRSVVVLLLGGTGMQARFHCRLARLAASVSGELLGSFSSFSQREEDDGVGLAALESWRSGKRECVPVVTFFLTRLASASRSSLHQCRDLRMVA